MTKNAPYIFISYSREDAIHVDRIVEKLESKGYRTWLDTTDIMPGTEWATEINSAITGAAAHIYVSSRHSVNSQWMASELSAAMNQADKNVVMIPVVLDHTGEFEMPVFLRKYQWIDLRGDFEKEIKKLIKAVKIAITPGEASQPKPKKNHGYAFISYSTYDTEFLEKLKSLLTDHQYGYWDFHENKRDYDMQFHLELEGVIRNSEVFLCLASPDWKKSRWASREFMYAEEIRKPIFILKAKPLEPTLLIAGSSYIDFSVDFTAGYAELDRELRGKGLNP